MISSRADRLRSALMIAITIALALAGCRRVPREVVDVPDMASLLADMHTAEAVVEIDMRDFSNDSLKMSLKQSVLQSHGVTQEQFDSSMMWYGHNIDKYIEVYDEVIKILEKRSQQAGAQILLDNQMLEGDSVDVWGASRYIVVNPRNPSHMVTFDLELDSATSKPGDMYIWRIKIIGADAGSVRWQMVANYPDSTFDYINTTTTNTPSRRGWNEALIVTDSTRVAKRLRGVLEVSIPNQTDVWIDSIALLRKPLDEDRYRQRARQRHYSEFYPPAPKQASRDTAAADSLSH